MKRLALLLLGTLALASALQSRARAQNAITDLLEVRVDGELLENQATVYIKANQCKPGIDFNFKVTGLLTTVKNYEVWASAGSDCYTSANRAKNETLTTPCWFLGQELGVTDGTEFTIPAVDIFRANAEDDSGVCVESSGNTYTVYFVPLNQPTTSNESMPPDTITDISPRRKAIFTLQTSPLEPPLSVSGENGENSVTVKWKKAPGAIATSEYRAFFDTSVGPDCADSKLVEGTKPPAVDNQTIFASGYDRALETSLGSLGGKGVEIGDFVAAAAMHKDMAGNVSPLSNVVCMQRVETTDFFDNCEDDDECKDGFDSCSVSPASRTRGLVGLGFLLALGVVLAVRRGRHV
jgi:hypothetical protein